jgi:hypothetical protein
MTALAGRQQRLMEEELFESEALAGPLDVLDRRRQLDRPQRIADGRQPPSRPQLRR